MHRLLFAVALCILLAACVQNATPDQMVSRGGVVIGPSSLLRSSISLGDVSGASGSSVVFLKSGVSSADFATALSETLDAHGMLTSSNGRFVLSAELKDLHQPAMGGFEMDVTSTVKYTLTNIGTSHVAFETTVQATFTADVEMTARAHERLQLATEGAMRENIKRFVEQLIVASQTDAGFSQP